MNFFVIHCLEGLVYPPGGPILLLVAGLLACIRWRRVALTLIVVGVISLYASSIPMTNAWMAQWLERDRSPDPATLDTAEAIVVLAFGAYYGPSEYGETTSNPGETARLRYAAFLHGKTGLPVAVIGGDRLKTGQIGADRMAQVLMREFKVPVRYRDGRSLHTFDNARYTREVLAKDNIDRILLVTHAWHMPRSKRAFERAGFSVIAAPTQFYASDPLEQGFLAWIPTAKAMERNHWYLHEMAGLLWFNLFEKKKQEDALVKGRPQSAGGDEKLWMKSVGTIFRKWNCASAPSWRPMIFPKRERRHTF